MAPVPPSSNATRTVSCTSGGGGRVNPTKPLPLASVRKGPPRTRHPETSPQPQRVVSNPVTTAQPTRMNAAVSPLFARDATKQLHGTDHQWIHREVTDRYNNHLQTPGHDSPTPDEMHVGLYGTTSVQQPQTNLLRTAFTNVFRNSKIPEKIGNQKPEPDYDSEFVITMSNGDGLQLPRSRAEVELHLMLERLTAGNTLEAGEVAPGIISHPIEIDEPDLVPGAGNPSLSAQDDANEMHEFDQGSGLQEAISSPEFFDCSETFAPCSDSSPTADEFAAGEDHVANVSHGDGNQADTRLSVNEQAVTAVNSAFNRARVRGETIVSEYRAVDDDEKSSIAPELEASPWVDFGPDNEASDLDEDELNGGKEYERQRNSAQPNLPTPSAPITRLPVVADSSPISNNSSRAAQAGPSASPERPRRTINVEATSGVAKFLLEQSQRHTDIDTRGSQEPTHISRPTPQGGLLGEIIEANASKDWQLWLEANNIKQWENGGNGGGVNNCLLRAMIQQASGDYTEVNETHAIFAEELRAIMINKYQSLPPDENGNRLLDGGDAGVAEAIGLINEQFGTNLRVITVHAIRDHAGKIRPWIAHDSNPNENPGSRAGEDMIALLWKSDHFVALTARDCAITNAVPHAT
jgi:hypothetical protein